MELKVGVGVMILIDHSILLGHRTHNYKDTGGIYETDTWCLPGGKMEVDETILECAFREVKEETNLSITDYDIFYVQDDIGSDRHFVTVDVIAKGYSGELKVCEPDKIDQWKWFDLDYLPSNLYSPSRQLINAYLRKE